MVNKSAALNWTNNQNSSAQIQTTNGNYPRNAFHNITSALLDTGNEQNSSYFTFYGLDYGTSSNLLNGIIVFSALTVLVNCIVLLASKFATGGKSATLVFIRSLCVADMLVGNFGIFKCVLLLNLDNRLINCFLPESIFISASTTICLTLFWLNVDSYLRLTKPLAYRMDKHSVIIAMMVLWNGAFIIGFLPQMGWNKEEFVCNLFNYYSIQYVIFISFLWLFCITGSCFMQGILHQTHKKIECNSEFISPQCLEYQKYSQLIATIRNDIIILSICYLPLISYIIFYFINERHKISNTAHINLIFFLPMFLLRSFTSAFIHSYRTIRMQRVMREVTRAMNMQLFKKMFNDTISSSDGTQSGQESMQTSRVNSIARSATRDCACREKLHKSDKIQVTQGCENGPQIGKPGFLESRGHRKLCATSSIITTVSEDDELSENSDITKL